MLVGYPCAPRFDRIGDELVRTTIRRMGKTAEALVDALEPAGGSSTLAELAEVLRVKRTRDLRRRALARLEEAAVVECSGETVSLTADWLDALNRERDLAGEIGELERVPDPAPELVEALAAFLDRNLRRRDEMPSWLSVALWADGYTSAKLPPAEIEAARAIMRERAA